MQGGDKNDSEAEASDVDEDAEAKAERLGQRMASFHDTLPASASRRPAAAAAPARVGEANYQDACALPFSQCNAMQEADDNDSDAEVSDIDEDAEAKAERLGLRLAANDDVLPALASRRSAAAAGTVQASGKKRALPPPFMEASGQGKEKSSKRSKKGRQPDTQGTMTEQCPVTPVTLCDPESLSNTVMCQMMPIAGTLAASDKTKGNLSALLPMALKHCCVCCRCCGNWRYAQGRRTAATGQYGRDGKQ